MLCHVVGHVVVGWLTMVVVKVDHRDVWFYYCRERYGDLAMDGCLEMAGRVIG